MLLDMDDIATAAYNAVQSKRCAPPATTPLIASTISIAMGQRK